MHDHVEEELIRMKRLTHSLANTKIEVEKEAQCKQSNKHIAVPKSLYLQEMISPEAIDLACDENTLDEIRKHFRVVEKHGEEPNPKQRKRHLLQVFPNAMIVMAFSMTLLFQMIQANTLKDRGFYQALEVFSFLWMLYGYRLRQRYK